MNYDQLFLQHVAASYDKQMLLSDLIGGNDWQFDMTAGTLSFGSEHTFRIQLLGTESTHSNTWLWAWANEASGIPANLLVASEQMKNVGRQHAIHEFLHPDWDLTDRLNGHMLSMIASGVCNCNAYYRGPYDGGALFMLIRDPAYWQPVSKPLLRVTTLFPQLVSNIPINDQQTAFRHYLAYYGAQVEEKGSEMTAQLDKDVITASFDQHRRLTNINSTLKPG